MLEEWEITIHASQETDPKSCFINEPHHEKTCFLHTYENKDTVPMFSLHK